MAEPVIADPGMTQVRCTAPDALSNLIAVLELAADQQLHYSPATRRPSAATVRLVEDALVGGDYYGADGPRTGGAAPIASFAWPLLLQAGGLAQLSASGGRCVLGLTPRGQAALACPSYVTLGELWDRWLTSVTHDELTRVDVIKGQRRAATLTSAARRRAAVAGVLADAEPGDWVAADTLFGLLRAQRPPLAVTRSLMARWRLYIGDPRRGALGLAGAAAWSAVEGRYALCVLFEYVATMGLVDLRYLAPDGARHDYQHLWGADGLASMSRYDGLLAVRVNELGAAILHDPATLPGLGLPRPRPDPAS